MGRKKRDYKHKRHKKIRRTRTMTRMKLKPETVRTIGAIWFWIFAGIITFSFFGEGSITSIIRDELSIQLGWGIYVLPPLLVSLSFLFFNSKSQITKPYVPAGFLLMFLSLISLTQAGNIGAFMWDIVTGFVRIEGALLIYISMLIIGLIVFFNTSLDKFVNFIFAGLVKLGTWISEIFNSLFSKNEESLYDKNRSGIRQSLDTKNKTIFKEPILLPPVEQKRQTKDKSLTNIMPVPVAANPQGAKEIWEYPPLELLSEGPKKKVDRGDTKRNAEIIEETLDGFGIQARVAEVNPGPAVTQYALQIALGTKVSKITSLSSDLALALAAPTGQVRIEAPIPGRNLVGIEIPNRGLEFVTLKNMLSHDVMQKNKSPLLVPLGLNVAGNPFVTDIAKMPHVLVAGATGSGKSVLINSWITSLLVRTTPEQVRLIMVDPKRVELTGYNDVPHLLAPVIVESEKILSSLGWAIKEMERRYKLFQQVGVRNIESYNEQSAFQALPYIIILIDELADLMMYAPAQVEDSICRLAQMARATGIHLVLATQRPSVDVLTGLIKANVPTRIAFNVTSMVDSRVIIDMPGAEKLLGRGDMLFIPPDQAKPTRIQGAFVTEKEVQRVVEFLKSRQPQVQYADEVLNQQISLIQGKRGLGGSGNTGDGKDPFFDDALRLVCQHDKASASLLQRRMSVGYARAARILDQLEEAGIIGPAEGSKPRDVLVKNAEEYIATKEAERNNTTV